MEQFVKDLQREMDDALEGVSIKSANSLQLAERSYLVVEGIIRKLREFMRTYTFRNEIEEIHFFKEVKPSFSKRMIFYIEQYHVEANRPLGDREVVRDHYRRETERVRIFLQRNQNLYNYYRSGKSSQDYALFIRNANQSEVVPEYTLDIDPLFSTVASLSLSKILAFEELHTYLLQCLQEPEPVPAAEASKNANSTKLVWTDSKAGLVEMIYGMHYTGALNNGQVGVKQIVAAFEQILNVDLGNVYRTFYEMSLRKKTPTPFLDKMKEGVLRRMDENNQ